MIKKTDNKVEIKYVLDNLRTEDKEEVIALLGSDWKEKILIDLDGKIVNVLFGFDKDGVKKPIAIGGFCEIKETDSKMACVWLLSTPLISKNKRLFFNKLKEQFLEAEQKYEILYNFIYKSNHSAKIWLKRFGFKFNNPNPEKIFLKENFEFFYKVIERKK